MARQDQVQFAPRVPVAWLLDYCAMLRAALEMQPPADATPEQIERNRRLDASIKERMDDVYAYLQRLSAGPKSIN